MFLNAREHRTIEKLSMDEYILTWIEAFLIDRKARGCAKGTLEFYGFKLKLFTNYCETQLVKNISQITPHFIRQYMLYLEEKDHNPGGRHAAFRALRAFLLWYEDEVDPFDTSVTLRLPDSRCGYVPTTKKKFPHNCRLAES